MKGLKYILMNRCGGPLGEGLRRNSAEVKPKGNLNAPAETPLQEDRQRSAGQYAK